MAKEELIQRFEKRKFRTGKDIPDFVIENMVKNFEFPTKNEGFEKIININDDKL